jgi:predicted transcriptional regulator YdeE
MKIVEKGSFFAIGVMVKAEWRELWTEMPKAWRNFMARPGDIGARLGDSFADISLEVTEGRYTQFICAPVARVEDVPDGMTAIEIPAGRYVHHCHVGPLAGIANSFGEIYDWARTNGHDTDEFKLDFGYTRGGDKPAHDLYVALAPVKPWREIAAG